MADEAARLDAERRKLERQLRRHPPLTLDGRPRVRLARFAPMTKLDIVQRSKRAKNGCWNWTRCIDATGYGMMGIHRPNKNTSEHAHRIAWRVWYGAFDSSLYMCHKCDNRRCVNPAHLFVGTPSQNQVDSKEKGRANRPHCEHHPKAKLNRRQVSFIRANYSYRHPKNGGCALGRRFGVSSNQILRIVRGQSWWL